MNLVFRIIYLVLHNTGRKIKMTNIIAIKCSNCGDWYKYYPVGIEEDTEFLGTETDCWNCNGNYFPFMSAVLMDEFIYDCFKRCKM